jgi:hypothetical protein
VALEAIAQVVGAPLVVLGRPCEGPLSSSYWHASFRNSVLDKWPGAGGGSGNSAAERARAVTRFAEHVHAFGRELEAAEAREISEILGARQPDLAMAEAALEEFVLTASLLRTEVVSAGPSRGCGTSRYLSIHDPPNFCDLREN